MKRLIPLRLLEAAGIAFVFLLGYGYPVSSGHGYLEAAASFLFPVLLFTALFRGRGLGWLYLALFLAFAAVFRWVPHTVAVMGNLPPALGVLSGGLLMAWEALGLLCVLALTRWTHRRGGPWGAAFSAALALILWECLGFHIYPWSLSASLGGLPWLARGAAFLGSHGLAGLCWGCGAFLGAQLAAGERRLRVAAAPLAMLAPLLCLSGLWSHLPRGPQRELDVVMVQPGFPPGLRCRGMEEEMWRRSDAELSRLGLPRAGVSTLLLWPESSVLGRDDRGPNPRLTQEAQRRGIAWIFGTEGGLLNLARGEAAGQPTYLQAKVNPMPFGERMPGPAFLRHWLDRNLGFVSQEPGSLTPESRFSMPTPQGPLRVHTLLCSEALSSARVLEGLHLAGGELLVNLTNDGWFEQSRATDLHAAQIRLRAVESGLPLLRATLTGKSGIFREDGSWVIWGEPRTEGVYGFHLTWSPVSTPARSPWVPKVLLVALCMAFLISARARVPAAPRRS